jgi:hypothetical protein
MSLAIDVDKVEAVLLADGTWYSVQDASFTMDAYEYIWWPNDTARERGDFEILHGGGAGGITSSGFRFKSEGRWLSGPLSAVLAVQDAQTDD